MTTTVFCNSNKDFLGSLAYDINALLNRWQSAADNGYGLYENWGNITQGFLNGFDGLCEWLPQSFITKAFAYTVMAALMGAWLAYQLVDIAALWWQVNQGTSYCLTLLQATGVALCVVLGGAIGVAGLLWEYAVPRVKAGLGYCGPVGEMFVVWLF